MTKLPEKLPVFNEPFDSRSAVEVTETVNALIDYLAEREGVHPYTFKEEPKPRSIWDLKKKDGEEYWCLDSAGTVLSQRFNSYLDELRRENGSVFLTREAAEAERDRRREMAKGL